MKTFGLQTLCGPLTLWICCGPFNTRLLSLYGHFPQELKETPVLLPRPLSAYLNSCVNKDYNTLIQLSISSACGSVFAYWPYSLEKYYIPTFIVDGFQKCRAILTLTCTHSHIHTNTHTHTNIECIISFIS